MDSNCLLKLIDFLYHSVIAEGGDGDALWYCSIKKLDTIMELVTQYNSQLEYPWQLKRTANDILWGDNQEWVHITANMDYFTKAPSWITLKLVY